MTILGILFGLPLLCAAIFSLIPFQIPPVSHCFDLEKNAFFELPSSAKDLEEHHLEYSSSCTVWIRFRLPPSELSSFVATTLVKPPLSAKIYPQLIGGIDYLQKETGWQIDSTASFLAGETSGTVQQPVDQFIFVDTSNPEDFTIYVTTSEGMI